MLLLLVALDKFYHDIPASLDLKKPAVMIPIATFEAAKDFRFRNRSDWTSILMAGSYFHIYIIIYNIRIIGFMHFAWLKHVSDNQLSYLGLENQ